MAKHQIHHGLDFPLAKKACDKAMDAYAARWADYDPSFEWTSDTAGEVTFRAKAMKIRGRIEIVGPVIHLELDVPFLFRIWSRKALEIIDEEVRMWIEKARAGELD